MSNDGAYQTIRYEVDEGVATLTMHRPDRRNAMNNAMVREAHAALQVAAADPSVRILVLTGTGSWFCPGADLNWVAEGGTDAADAGSTADDFQVPSLLHHMSAVTIAAVNGPCAGAALGWAAGCDLRVAATSAKFNSAFLDVGVAGDMGSPWTLTRLVGAAKARELFFLPDKFSADEARRIGLVARVYPDDVFRDEVQALVNRLSAASPAALRTMKANFLDAERMELPEFLRVETERHHHLFTLADTHEAFAAKVEKRKPNFKGV